MKVSSKTAGYSALACFTAGGGLLAVIGDKAAVDAAWALPPLAWHFLLVIGIAFVAAGMVFGGVTLVSNPALWLRQAMGVTIGTTAYEFVPAREQDLQSLATFYSHFFGADVPRLEQMLAWNRRAQPSFWLVNELRGTLADGESRRLVGSFKIMPVTRSAVKRLDAETVSGSTFEPQHIARRPRDTAAYYIGDVAATSRPARAAVVAYLRAMLGRGEFNRYAFYARPLKDDGRALMHTYGFRGVTDGREPRMGRMCVLRPRARSVSATKRPTKSTVSPLGRSQRPRGTL